MSDDTSTSDTSDTVLSTEQDREDDTADDAFPPALIPSEEDEPGLTSDESRAKAGPGVESGME